MGSTEQVFQFRIVQALGHIQESFGMLQSEGKHSQKRNMVKRLLNSFGL